MEANEQGYRAIFKHATIPELNMMRGIAYQNRGEPYSQRLSKPSCINEPRWIAVIDLIEDELRRRTGLHIEYCDICNSPHEEVRVTGAGYPYVFILNTTHYRGPSSNRSVSIFGDVIPKAEWMDLSEEPERSEARASLRVILGDLNMKKCEDVPYKEWGRR